MSAHYLQTDKLIPIRLPEICAPRAELLKCFDRAAGKRYIYVNAPGGFGKTVSTLLWIQKSGYVPIWLSLDKYDNTPSTFFRFLCTALFSAMPQKESLTGIILEPSFNDSPVEYTIDILSRFSFDARKYALVLDDFYFITNEEILKSMIYILSRLPISITVIFLSRSECQYFPSFHRTHRDYSHYALDTEKNFAEFRLVFFTMLGKYYNIIESGVRAGILYEKNLLKESLSLVSRDPETDSDELVFLSKVHTASCLFSMGREEEAARCRDDIKKFLETRNLLYLLPVFSAYEAKLKLMNGDRTAASAWLENYFISDSQDMELHKIYLYFTTARAYIVLGEYKKAQALCERIKALSCDFGRLLDSIEASVLLIILAWITGKKKDAVLMLRSALAGSEQYHFVRVFADEGKAILPVISRLMKQSDEDGEQAPDHKYLHEVYQAAYSMSKRHKGIVCVPGKTIKLSRQQKYILELLAKGFKNAEIVEMTGLSINTIRSHTKVAYQKLEVNSVYDAVLRARELELID